MFLDLVFCKSCISVVFNSKYTHNSRKENSYDARDFFSVEQVE